MKTKFISRIAGAAAMFLAIFAAPALKAQIACPYNILNTFGCDVDVLWTVTSTASGCNVGCATSPSPVNILSGGTLSIPCAVLTGCGTTCFIKISIMSVDGVPLAAPISGHSNIGTPVSGAGAGACPGTVNMSVAATGATIY